MAAGFDKDARVADAILQLGFGFTEAGTLTPNPQPGNAKPRLFRLHEDRGVTETCTDPPARATTAPGPVEFESRIWN